MLLEACFQRNIRGPPFVRDELSGARWTEISTLCLSSVVACVESMWVSAFTVDIYIYVVCGEMKSLKTEGRRMRMGSLNAKVASCGTVTTLPHRSGCATTACGPHMNAKLSPFALCQLSCTCSSLIEYWHKPDGSNFASQICWVRWVSGHLQGRRELSQDAARVRTQAVTANHQLAGKLTTNT